MKILKYPDSFLLKTSRIITKKEIKVGKIENKHSILCLSKNMIKIMYENNGIGLAAPQIGLSLNLIVLDISKYRNNPMVLINTNIICNERPEKTIMEEGCLSFPTSFRINIERYETIRLSYFNENGNYLEIPFTGLLSRVVQHEYDHIRGILISDYLK